MNPLKYKAGDKVYAKFQTVGEGDVRITLGTVLEFRPELDRYKVRVHDYPQHDFAMIEEDLLTYVEAVAERLRGKVRL